MLYPITETMAEVLELNQAEIRALLKLIEFHTEAIVDDEAEDELNDILGVNVAQLHNKVSALVTY
jgi:hypothetical protein